MYEREPENKGCMDEVEIYIYPLPWQDSENLVDCGIYVLAHMEFYEGQPLDKWDIGLKPCDVSCSFLNSI